MFKLTLLFLWPRFYAQTSSLSSPLVKYLYKYVLRFCSLVAMLPRRRRTGRKAGGVSCFRFQNECNKVEIALRVVQFWSEIKLVITNRTTASRSCDFVITRLISDQIALHSEQLPLLKNFTLCILYIIIHGLHPYVHNLALPYFSVPYLV